MNQPSRSPLRWNFVLVLVLVLAESGCGDPPVAPKTVSVRGTLAPAAGRDPSAFAVWGTNGSEASTVTADGSFTADVTQAVGTPVQYRMGSDGVVVSSLVQTAADDQGVTLQLKTRKGTGLDYRYLVRRINPSATTAGETSPVLTTPNQRQVTATTEVLRQGFLSASSYWGYADIVGLAMKQFSTLVINATGATAGQPSGTFTLPAQGFYEVRLFSGGMGARDDQTSIFAVHNFHAELDATATYNLCAATVEVLSLIPGVSEMLGDAVGQKTLMAAVQQAVAEVQKLLVTEAVPTAGELYDALNAVLDKTVKSFVTESVKQAGTGAGGNTLRRGFDWLVGGGQRVIKFVGAVPGRVAKGGAAMNRLYSLISPESIAEYHVVAVAPYTAPVTCVPDPAPTTCATGDCDDVTNNCGLIVNCGPCQQGVCSGKEFHEPTYSCSVKADCFKTQACVAGRCESWGRSCK